MRRIEMVLVILLFGAYPVMAASEEKMPPPYDKTISNTQALDIVESVCREYFGKPQLSTNAAYFLYLFGKDPSPEFLNRFAAQAPSVKKGTEFARGLGLKLYVMSIKRISDAKVEVPCSWTKGRSEEGGGFTSIVEFKEGKWVVTEVALRYVF